MYIRGVVLCTSYFPYPSAPPFLIAGFEMLLWHVESPLSRQPRPGRLAVATQLASRDSMTPYISRFPALPSASGSLAVRHTR